MKKAELKKFAKDNGLTLAEAKKQTSNNKDRTVAFVEAFKKADNDDKKSFVFSLLDDVFENIYTAVLECGEERIGLGDSDNQPIINLSEIWAANPVNCDDMMKINIMIQPPALPRNMNHFLLQNMMTGSICDSYKATNAVILKQGVDSIGKKDAIVTGVMVTSKSGWPVQIACYLSPINTFYIALTCPFSEEELVEWADNSGLSED